MCAFVVVFSVMQDKLCTSQHRVLPNGIITLWSFLYFSWKQRLVNRYSFFYVNQHFKQNILGPAGSLWHYSSHPLNSAGGKGDNVWLTDVVFVRLCKTGGKYYPLELEELLTGACEIQQGRRFFILGLINLVYRECKKGTLLSVL